MPAYDSADSSLLVFGSGTGAGYQKGMGEAVDVSRPCLTHRHVCGLLNSITSSQQSPLVTGLVTRLQSTSVAGPSSAPSITANLFLLPSSSSLGGKTWGIWGKRKWMKKNREQNKQENEKSRSKCCSGGHSISNHTLAKRAFRLLNL